MCKKNLAQKIYAVFSKHQEAIATMIVALPGVGLDAIAEYNTAGISPYLKRDFFYLTVMTFCFLAFKYNFIKRKDIFKIPVYTIVIGQMISVFYRIQDPLYDFEPYFLKTELIYALMMFGIGNLVHAKHIGVFLILNIIFIVSCYFAVPHFSTSKLIFYSVMVNSSTLLVFFSQRMLVQLYKKLKDATKIIEFKNEELNKINLANDQIFKIIGHDLKTPFHQVQSLVDLIDVSQGEEGINKIKSLLKESAGKGNQLLEDLLKWSASYKKNSEIKLKKHNISEVVTNVFKFSDLNCKDKEITLINKLPKDLNMLINLTMMETVLRNLIINAIKFSYRGSSITINYTIMNKMVKLSIIDKGVGISSDRLIELISNNINESTTGTESEFGSGFGLNIAKELVEKQNGIFEILSKVNKGTSVNLYFPLAE